MAVATTPGAPDIGPHHFEDTLPVHNSRRRHLIVGGVATTAIVSVLATFGALKINGDSNADPVDPDFPIADVMEVPDSERSAAIRASSLPESDKELLQQTDYPATYFEPDLNDPISAFQATIRSLYAANNLRDPELLAQVYGVDGFAPGDSHLDFMMTYPNMHRPEFIITYADDPDCGPQANDDFCVVYNPDGTTTITGSYLAHTINRGATTGQLFDQGSYTEGILGTEDPLHAITTITLDSQGVLVAAQTDNETIDQTQYIS